MQKSIIQLNLMQLNTILCYIQQLNVGRAAEAGIAIVLLAIVLDRITQAYGETLQERRTPAKKKK